MRDFSEDFEYLSNQLDDKGKWLLKHLINMTEFAFRTLEKFINEEEIKIEIGNFVKEELK